MAVPVSTTRAVPAEKKRPGFFDRYLPAWVVLCMGGGYRSGKGAAGQHFDYVVTVCDHARDKCPVFHAATSRIPWSFDDPAAVEGPEEQRLAAFRRIRDELRDRLTGLHE